MSDRGPWSNAADRFSKGHSAAGSSMDRVGAQMQEHQVAGGCSSPVTGEGLDQGCAKEVV